MRGGRVSAGAERLAGIDHDVDVSASRAGGPVSQDGRHHDPAAGDRDRLVEVAPAVGPVVGDLGRADLDQAVAGGRLELGQLRQLAGRAVDRVLDPAVALPPPRPRPAPARAARRARARRARAGSGPRAGSTRAVERLVRAAWRGRARFARACAGSSTSTTHVLRRRACPPRSGGRPRPLSRSTWPGCVPAGILTSRSPSSVGDRRPCRRPSPASPATSSDRDQVLAAALEALVVGDRRRPRRGRPAGRRARRRGRRRRSGSAGRTRSRPGSRRPRCARAARGRRRRRRSHGCSGILPSPPQVGQAPACTSWPNAVRRTCRTWPCAAAGLAGVDRRARLGAVAVAVLASRDRLEGDLALDAGEHLGERRSRPRRRCRRRTPGPRAAAAEQVAEQRVRPAAEERPRGCPRSLPAGVRRPAAAAQALVAVGVVGAPALGVGEDLVGLGGLLELLLRLGVVAVDVRVQLAGERAERLLDLGLARVPARRRGPRSSRAARLRAHS